jgi:hypothetical protein
VSACAGSDVKAGSSGIGTRSVVSACAGSDVKAGSGGIGTRSVVSACAGSDVKAGSGGIGTRSVVSGSEQSAGGDRTTWRSSGSVLISCAMRCCCMCASNDKDKRGSDASDDTTHRLLSCHVRLTGWLSPARPLCWCATATACTC